MKRLAVLALSAPLAAFAWLACEDPVSHIYAAQLFDPDADCLYPGTSLDIVPGAPSDGGDCDAICITDLDGDVYISTQCPPLPIEYDLTGKAPACKTAFEARCRQCPIEAGMRIETVCDAGVMPEAGSDAPHKARRE